VQLTLIRHATLVVEAAGERVLVDPMLDPAGARGPVADTPNDRRNPLVELPEPAEVAASRLTAVAITHMHEDHLDDTAVALLDKALPVLCQPPDEDTLRGRGFGDVRPVAPTLQIGRIAVARTDGRHGTGELAEQLGPVSGFVFRVPGEPVAYVAGDTVYCEEVEAALDEHRPDVVVVNAGGARFNHGDPITMTAGDVVAVARRAPDALVVAVHLEAINHCIETRADLRERIHAQGLEDRVTVPEDGSAVALPV